MVSSVVHDAVRLRLAGVRQRYTADRQALVETLLVSGRPLTVPEILLMLAEMPQSSAYRNVAKLLELDVIRRVAGTDEHGRFELAESFSGHHHHLMCARCGRVEDVPASPKLERAPGGCRPVDGS